MLINIAIEQMLADSEPELGCAFQIMGVIRILLDPENMITGKTDFLNFFYKHSIQTLIGESIVVVVYLLFLNEQTPLLTIDLVKLPMLYRCL